MASMPEKGKPQPFSTTKPGQTQPPKPGAMPPKPGASPAKPAQPHQPQKKK